MHFTDDICVLTVIYLSLFFEVKAMFDFEEELKKFKPSLEIDQAEEAIYKNDLRDVTDILEDMMKEVKIASGNKRF